MPEATAVAAKKDRSPNYPAIGFDQALRYTEIIWKEEKKNPTKPEIAAGHLKMGWHGRSKAVMGAMRQYGLIEYVAGDVRITDAARTIVLSPEGDVARTGIIRRLALQPAIFQQIIAKYGAELPSDATLASKLQLEWNFASSDAAERCIKSLHESLTVAGPLSDPRAAPEPAILLGEPPEEDLLEMQPPPFVQPPARVAPPPLATPPQIPAPPASPRAGEMLDRWTLGEESATAMITLTGDIGEAELEDLEGHLKVFMNRLKRRLKADKAPLPPEDRPQ